MATIQPWLSKGSRHKFRAEIFKLLDAVEMGTELSEARVFQAAINENQKSGEAPSFEKVEQDVRLRLSRGDIDARQAQDILDRTRETIAHRSRKAERIRLALYELEAKAHDAFIREARLLEGPLKQRWNDLFEQDRKLKAALPPNVHDDSSAIRAGEKAVRDWMRRVKVYPRLSTIWSIATKLRAVSILGSVTTGSFWPAEYMWRYPDRLFGVSNPWGSPVRNIADKITSFDVNISRGAEPGFYTADDLRRFMAEEDRQAAENAKPVGTRAAFLR